MFQSYRAFRNSKEVLWINGTCQNLGHNEKWSNMIYLVFLLKSIFSESSTFSKEMFYFLTTPYNFTHISFWEYKYRNHARKWKIFFKCNALKKNSFREVYSKVCFFLKKRWVQHGFMIFHTNQQKMGTMQIVTTRERTLWWPNFHTC